VRRGVGRAGSLAATASQALRPGFGLRRSLLLVVLVLAAGCGGESDEPEGVPSAAGLYSVRLESPPAESPVNEVHAWHLELREADGDPVEGATIGVEGDMPAHGHGLPTEPEARDLGGGRYEIEGMKFQMGGAWFVELAIDAPPGHDTVRVEFTLPEG
jgi:YtkA-like